MGDVFPAPLVEALEKRADAAGISRAEALWALARILERPGNDLDKALQAEEELVHVQKKYRFGELQHYKTHQVLQQKERDLRRQADRLRSYRQFINHRRGRAIRQEELEALLAKPLHFGSDQDTHRDATAKAIWEKLRSAQPEKPPPETASTSVSQDGRLPT